MCGIAGIGGLGDHELVRKMSQKLVHRGPDSDGYFVTKEVSLGVRRLKIIDLATGDQPMSNEDETVWTVLNGEIYNYRELREGLIKRGHRFKTKSDTEVLVHLYEEKGEKMLEDLCGMFAFAIWSEKEKKLFAARDRFGIKPLFYCLLNQKFYFASEIKGLLAVPEISKEVHSQAVLDYFNFLYIPGPQTVFRSIKKLLPAHYAVYQKEELTLRPYWNLSEIPEKKIPFKEAQEKYGSLLQESVRLHLRSDVPWGLFLSGGVDSSALAYTARSVTSRPLHTFSVGFRESDYNELRDAKLMARQLQTEHHELVLDPQEAWILPEIVDFFDEPFGDASAIPAYFVSKLARSKVTVSLSGEGSDDTISGYPWHYSTLLTYFFTSALRQIGLRDSKISPSEARSGKAAGGTGRLARFWGGIGKDLDDLYFYKMTGALSGEIRGFLRKEFSESLDFSSPFRDFRRRFAASRSASRIRRLLEMDVAYYLPDDLLTKVDRMSMAHSLEVRAPFLDPVLVEFVFSLPGHYKLRGATTKYILRRAMREKLPREILNKPKHGFSLPLNAWLRKDWRQKASELLLDPKSRCYEFLDPAGVKKIWEDHQRGRRDLGLEIWGLLFFEQWCRHYL